MKVQPRQLAVFAIAAGFMLIACNLNTVMQPPSPTPTAIIGPSSSTSLPSLLIVSPTVMPFLDTQAPPSMPLPLVIVPASPLPVSTPIPSEPPPTDTIPTDPNVTVIDGASFGASYDFGWQLSAAGDAPVEQQHIFRVTGMAPPSPSSSSRTVNLTITCEGSGAESFRWGTGSQRPALECGASETIWVTDVVDTFLIEAVARPGTPVELTYSLHIIIGNPY